MTMVDAVLSTYERVTDRTRRDRAFKAAEEKYGAMAGDPGLFSALRDYEYGEEREMDRREAHDQNMQIRGASERRAQGEYDFRRESADAQRRQDAILNLVRGLRSARDRGEDLGEAFDALADSLPGLGVAAEDIPKMREELLENPDILDDYYASLTSGTGGTAGADGGTASGGPPTAEQQRAIDDVWKRISVLEDPEREDAARSIFGLPTPGKIASGGFGMVGSVPGTAASDYVTNLEALENDIRNMAFATLKGGGQITEKESEFAAGAIGKIRRAGSYAEYRRELERLKDYLRALEGHAARRARGEVEGDLAYPGSTTPEGGNPGAPSSGVLVVGSVYTAPDGTKGRVVGINEDGTAIWEPVE